jgi:DNA-binding SARP family transcriptional activator
MAPATPLAITALGPLTVTVDRRTLTLAQWRSARSRRLFQLLLVHRFRWVPRDEIIEALWPEADPDKGVNNLRQAIHLLRKLLEPGLDKPGSSSYIRYRNEACRLEGGEGCSYDVTELEAAFARAERHCSRGRRSEARPHLERVAELYAGSFLQESPYEDFAALERESLRDRFLRGLGLLIELEAGEKNWERVVPLCRRGLDQAPYQEELHWHLVRSLHRLGHRHEALEAYRQYERSMVRELDLLPSARMQDLARQVSKVKNS